MNLAEEAHTSLRLANIAAPLEFEIPPARILEGALTSSELEEVQAWAEKRRTDARGGYPLDPVPAPLADLEWFEEDEPDPEEDEDGPPQAPSPAPIPWNGAGAIPERLQVVEGWTDHTLVRRAIADPSVQKAVRERLERISEDLSEIAGIETRLREGAGRLGALTRLSPIDEGRLSKIEGRKRPTPTRGVLEACTRVRALAPELALQATGFRPAPTPEPVSPALDEARALIAAEQAPETPAAPANPRTRAAYLRQLAEESDREASRRRAEADALDPQPAAPAGSGFAAAAAELAAACATLRVETGCGLIREGELPEAIRSALADQARRIEILKVDLTGSNAEIEERDAEIAAAWTALGDAQGATIAEAIRDRVRVLRAEIAAAQAAARQAAEALDANDRGAPTWDGSRLIALRPVELGQVSQDEDGLWTWDAETEDGPETGEAPTEARARARVEAAAGVAP